MKTDDVLNQNAELRRRLEEAEETIRAIQAGAVDALVIAESDGHRVYTLEGADRPYRLMVEQMQQGAATLQTDGTIVFCNMRLAEMLATDHKSLVGRPLREFVAPEDAEAYDALFCASHRNASEGEVQLRRGDDGTFPAYFSFNRLPLDSEATLGLLISDLTAQRHHERLSEAHEALRVADARLMESDRRKTEFLATLAHELRGPLAPLSNMLQVLKHADHDAALLARARETMERQLGQLVRLVDDLLDINRISQGKIQLKRQRVELATVVERAVEACAPFVEARHHRLHVALPNHTVMLDADPARLAQVFGNLINNACKYMDPGGDIWLTAIHTDGDVQIRVRDSGLGIPADRLDGIFEMFSQVEDTLKRAQGGLGIGLSLVRQLVEMHGGTVQAYSDGPGRGSEFVIRLRTASA